jgi:hypothetical protein
MGHTHQPPLTTDVVQATQQEPTETPSFSDLAKYGFHDDFASRVHCTPFWCPHFCRHALLRGGEQVRACHLRGMVALTLCRHVRIKPQLLHGGSRCRAVRAAILRGWNFRSGTWALRINTTGSPVDRHRIKKV